MHQIFYVRPEEDRSWVVSRFGKPIARLETPDAALDMGGRIARQAAAGGVTTELRFAGADRSYRILSVFEGDMRL